MLQKTEIIKDYLAQNVELSQCLNMVALYCINNKTLKLNETSFDFNIQYLLDEKILEKRESNYWLKDENGYLTYTLYQVFPKENDFEPTTGFKPKAHQINQITNYFKSDNDTYNPWIIEQLLWAICIEDANASYSEDFTDYILSLKEADNPDEINNFYTGYFKLIENLNLSAESLSRNAIQLHEIRNKHKLDSYDILQSIREIAFHDKNNIGIDCYNYLVKNIDKSQSILYYVISGIYDSKGIKFYEHTLSSVFTNPKNQVAIICGLANIKTVREQDALLLLNLYENCDDTNEILMCKHKLLFAITESTEIESLGQLIPICFEHFRNLINYNNQGLNKLILQRITYTKKYLDENFNLLLNIVRQDDFDINSDLNIVGNFFFNGITIEWLRQLTDIICNKKGLFKIYKQLHYGIGLLYRDNKVELDNLVVSLLTSNSARCRYIGHNIAHKINTERAYTFDCDILGLSPLDQYKLWVSLCAEYNEPKQVLPSFLPLINSNSSLIKESVLCKIEEYAENYGEAVVEVLQSYFEQKQTVDNDVLDRISRHLKEHIETKRAIKTNINELNPYLIQNEYITEYNKCFIQKNSKALSESSKDSFFRSLFKSTMLLKSGGLKMDDRNEILKLDKYSSNYSFPRVYFIDPEKFDFECRQFMCTDWDEQAFSLIKEALEDEQ